MGKKEDLQMKDKTIFLIIFIPILLASLFEITLLGIAFFGADKIECNLLWCSFETTRTTIDKTQECYHNGIKINCSEVIDIEELIKNAKDNKI